MEPREGLSGAARLPCRLFGLAVGLVYVTRLWFLLIPAVLLTVVGWSYRISKKRRGQAVDAESVLPHAALPDPYQRICANITKQLRTVCPEAKWVWERPDARAALFAGEHVGIRCNRAGGYRRAFVRLDDALHVILQFESAPTPQTQEMPTEKPTSAEPIPENYGLLAFEWVDAHIMELNDRCNNAIGQGETSVLIEAQALPSRPAWEAVCEELHRVELENVTIVPEGIRILLQDAERK